MKTIINISLRVRHNAEHPLQSAVLLSAGLDGVEMSPVMATGNLARVGDLISQVVDDALIQARTAREQQDTAVTTGCEIDLPTDHGAVSSAGNTPATDNTEPQLTLLNFG